MEPTISYPADDTYLLRISEALDERATVDPLLAPVVDLKHWDKAIYLHGVIGDAGSLPR